MRRINYIFGVLVLLSLSVGIGSCGGGNVGCGPQHPKKNDLTGITGKVIEYIVPGKDDYFNLKNYFEGKHRPVMVKFFGELKPNNQMPTDTYDWSEYFSDVVVVAKNSKDKIRFSNFRVIDSTYSTWDKEYRCELTVVNGKKVWSSEYNNGGGVGSACDELRFDVEILSPLGATEPVSFKIVSTVSKPLVTWTRAQETEGDVNKWVGELDVTYWNAVGGSGYVRVIDDFPSVLTRPLPYGASFNPLAPLYDLWEKVIKRKNNRIINYPPHLPIGVYFNDRIERMGIFTPEESLMYGGIGELQLPDSYPFGHNNYIAYWDSNGVEVGIRSKNEEWIYTPEGLPPDKDIDIYLPSEDYTSFRPRGLTYFFNPVTREFFGYPVRDENGYSLSRDYLIRLKTSDLKFIKNNFLANVFRESIVGRLPTFDLKLWLKHDENQKLFFKFVNFSSGSNPFTDATAIFWYFRNEAIYNELSNNSGFQPVEEPASSNGESSANLRYYPTGYTMEILGGYMFPPSSDIMKGYSALYDIYNPNESIKFIFPIFIENTYLKAALEYKTLPPNMGFMGIVKVKEGSLNTQMKAGVVGIDGGIISSFPKDISRLPKTSVFVPLPLGFFEKMFSNIWFVYNSEDDKYHIYLLGSNSSFDQANLLGVFEDLIDFYEKAFTNEVCAQVDASNGMYWNLSQFLAEFYKPKDSGTINRKYKGDGWSAQVYNFRVGHPSISTHIEQDKVTIKVVEKIKFTVRAWIEGISVTSNQNRIIIYTDLNFLRNEKSNTFDFKVNVDYKAKLTNDLFQLVGAENKIKGNLKSLIESLKEEIRRLLMEYFKFWFDFQLERRFFNQLGGLGVYDGLASLFDGKVTFINKSDAIDIAKDFEIYNEKDGFVLDKEIMDIVWSYLTLKDVVFLNPYCNSLKYYGEIFNANYSNKEKHERFIDVAERVGGKEVISIIRGNYETEAPNGAFNLSDFYINNLYVYKMECNKVLPASNLRDQLKIGGCRGTDEVFTHSLQSPMEVTKKWQYFLKSLLWDYVKVDYDFDGKQPTLRSFKICVNRPICMFKFIVPKGVYQ